MKNLIHILERNLKDLGYKINSNTELLDIDYFLKTLNFIFVEGNKEFYQYILDNEYNLYAMSDFDFVGSVIKIHSKLFERNPEIQLNQFF